MARGMDVENVKYVISYDPPPFIKTYIHRVGRTARAGKVGTAITMLQKKEVNLPYSMQHKPFLLFNWFTCPKCELFSSSFGVCYSDLTVCVALRLLQLIQNSDQIAICLIKPKCSIGQKFEQTVQSIGGEQH